MRDLDVIWHAADRAQAGEWPTDPDRLCRLLRYSTASREFIAHARRDVLDLVAEVRQLRRAASDGSADVSGTVLATVDPDGAHDPHDPP